MKELDKYVDTTDMLEIWIEFIKNPSSKKVESLEMNLKEIKEEGIKEGIESVARNLLDILDDETISLKTGLTVEDIKKLRK